MSKKYVQSTTLYQAGSGNIVGATTITLTSLIDCYGNILTMTDFGDKGYCTAEPETNNEDPFIFTGVTANTNGTYTLTGVKSILAKSPYTEQAAMTRQHAGGTPIIITDNVGFWSTFANKSNDETITGSWTAPNQLTSGSSLVATEADIAAAITGASGTATNTSFGTVKLSVAAASAPNPIVVGDNDPRVPTQGENDALVGNNTDIAVGTGNKLITQTGLQHNAEKYAVDTGSSTAYVIALSPVPTSLTAGMVVYAKLVNANTTTTPTLTVTGTATAKTIVKGINTPLLVGDIGANQLCNLQYDGTNFVLLNPTVVDPSTGIYNNTLNTNPTSNSYYTYQAPILSTSSSLFIGWTAGSATIGAGVGGGGTTRVTGAGAWSLFTTIPGNTSTGNIYIPNEGKSISIKQRCGFSGNTTIGGFGLGVSGTPGIFGLAETATTAGIRFVNNNGALFAQNANGTTATSTNITGSLTLTNWNTYEIVFTPGVSVQFYVNGTLVATQTTNLPTSQQLNLGYGTSAALAIDTFPPLITLQM